MASTPQQQDLPITLGIRDLGKRAGARLMDFVRAVVRESGKQESVASDLGISPELLSQALRSQRTFHAEWLPAILRYDHRRQILGYLAWEAHCRVEPIDPFTDAHYRKAAEEVLRGEGAFGEHVRALIIERAQGVSAEAEEEERGK